jgi:hypothetical protein
MTTENAAPREDPPYDPDAEDAAGNVPFDRQVNEDTPPTTLSASDAEAFLVERGYDIAACEAAGIKGFRALRELIEAAHAEGRAAGILSVQLEGK